MGGIAGIISFSRGRADPRRVDRMLEILDHRGPDDRAIRRSANGRMVLGGCRALFDECDAAAPWPLINETEDVWAILDGEIDNHRALRHSLCLDGHNFHSNAAGEVVVHAYEQYGLGCFEHLHGRFALALWDDRRHRLVLARDRLGERPLYWTRVDGMLAFGSEATALLDALPIPRRLDLDSLPEFLAHGFVLAPNTLVEGVRKLGPGEALVVERGNRIQPLTWWTPCRDERRSSAVRALSVEHHEDNLRVLLDSAIADRLTANLPVAAMLDGEPESLAMAASMSRLLGRRVEALVLGEEEASRLAATGDTLGLKITPVAPGQGQMLASLPDYLRAMDEPLTDPSALRVWWMARAMSNSGLSVALASAGAGAVLLGADLLARHRHIPSLWRLLRALPPGGRRWGARLLAPLVGLLSRRVSAEALHQALEGEPPLPSPEPLFVDPGFLFGPDMKTLGRNRPCGEALARARRAMPSWIATDELGALAFVETRTSIAEGQLMALDRMAMAHSVEMRLPFLDDALVDYALAIPSHERAPRGRPKDLILRALRGLLPVNAAFGETMVRPTPMAEWFKGALGNIFEDSVNSSSLFRSGLFDREYCLTLLDEHRAGRQDRLRQLWTLLVLSRWIDMHRLEVPGGYFSEPLRRAAVG
jgi:asparagine synthase (glutamine-hydrolysing)